MDIRPILPGDLNRLIDIDGTIESSQYLHVAFVGEGFTGAWKIEERPLREKRMQRNPTTDETLFVLKQVVMGTEDGVALLVEHDQVNVGLLVARDDAEYGTLRLQDLRVDFERRHEGLGAALVYRLIAEARSREVRAVAAETRTDNFPAARFLTRCGFELAGLDARRLSNHDLVKESATLFWYAALD